MPLIAERVAQLDALKLDHGAHTSWADGHCAMEVVAWLAGQEHSDSPPCVSPVLASFVRRWNDDLDEPGRQMLKPFLPRLIGTAGDPAADAQRGWMAADWLIRVHTPAWLELAGITESAAALRALPPLTDLASLRGAEPALNEARSKASAVWDAAWAAVRDAVRDAVWDAAWAAVRDAVRDAAWDAAWAAAGDAVRDAAWDAVWDAAGAAVRDAVRDAAWDAVRDAVRDAVWDAAWAAAGKKLEPTKVALQASALGLLDRMIAA